MVEGQQSGGEATDGEVYLCPICNTRVSPEATECPGCGAIFVDEEPSEPTLTAKAMEYRCPICGGTVTEDDPTCPHCGALFAEGQTEEAEPEPPAAERPPEPAEGRKAPSGARRAPGGKQAPEEAPEWEATGALDGVRVPSLSYKGRPKTAATHRRESARARYSRSVQRLSQRRRLIAKRRMLGLSLLGLGFAIYIISLILAKPEGLTAGSLGVLAVSISLILLGSLIIYNQHQAWRHYQTQLQTARVEAALLRGKGTRAGDVGGSATARTPEAVATPAPASGAGTMSQTRAAPKAKVATPARASSARSVPRVTGAAVEVPAPEPEADSDVRVVSGAAAEAGGRVPITRHVRPTEEPIMAPPERPEDRDKVPCPNCGYLNRSIFVRCIRCGTELAPREDSISVETFERPTAPDATASPRPRGGPMPWEARHASTSGGRAAARQAARQAAREDEEPGTEDRRAAIGVAANFTKLPKNMREELIRTLYKVEDPVVRQDTVSAIAEHYTELPKDIQDLLLDLADDEDPRVREEVAFEANRNFDRIPMGVIRNIFGKLAKDPENLVREDVVSAIAENFQRLPKEVQDLLKALAKDDEESVRDEVSFEVAKNADVIPEKFKSEVKEILRRTAG